MKVENAYVLVDLQTREIKGTYNAVSYTHLDVYKRQIYMNIYTHIEQNV